MKKLMILGALIGFSSGVLLGVFQATPWPEILWRASLMSFVSSYLFRWWGRVWLSSFRQAQQSRLSAESMQPTPAKV